MARTHTMNLFSHYNTAAMSHTRTRTRRTRNTFVSLERRIARVDRRVTQARTEYTRTQARMSQARVNLALAYAGLVASVLSLAYILA